MQLSTKGRYAVMAMTDLAKQIDDKAVSLADIAARQEISLSYLEQLFARLRRGGLVKSVRGPGGGYRLARSPSDTSVAELPGRRISRLACVAAGKLASASTISSPWPMDASTCKRSGESSGERPINIEEDKKISWIRS